MRQNGKQLPPPRGQGSVEVDADNSAQAGEKASDAFARQGLRGVDPLSIDVEEVPEERQRTAPPISQDEIDEIHARIVGGFVDNMIDQIYESVNSTANDLEKALLDAGMDKQIASAEADYWKEHALDNIRDEL